MEIQELKKKAEIEQKRRFKELTPEERDEIEEILSSDADEIIAEAFNIEITTKLISCLIPGTWLNDEVINFYLSLLSERCNRFLKAPQILEERKVKCHFFNSFFYTKMTQGRGYNYNNVKKWSSRAKVDILSMDKVIIPIHVGNNHWCLCCINFKEKRFEYYDSLGGGNKQCLVNMRKYVQDEAKTYKKIANYSLDGWKDYCPSNIPRQTNGCDCGVFTLKYADYISENCPFNFTQRHMKLFRDRMILEIRNKIVN